MTGATTETATNHCEWDESCESKAVGHLNGPGFRIAVCAQHASALMTPTTSPEAGGDRG